jgi:dTDP-4-dehydrorhamnose reductase
MNSILVTGAKGQLGASIGNIISDTDNAKYFFSDIDTLDISNKTAIETFVIENNIELIINCAAYTAVDRAEDDTVLCEKINFLAVKNIAEVASMHNIKVIHISTDYVFDGTGDIPYKENDETNPASVYGITKLKGEKVLMETLNDAVIIRTSWLYSETGNNFVKTMLRLGKERAEMGIVADQTGSPTYAHDLALAIKAIFTSAHFVPGIYHYCNKGACTWFEFTKAIFEIAGISCNVKSLKTSEYSTKAKRPAYSVLDTSKIQYIYNVEIPEWIESLKKCLINLGELSV